MHSEFNHIGFDTYISVDDLHNKEKRISVENKGGIYILHFSNGEYYVGQAKEFLKRLRQHLTNYNDIEYVSFKEVSNEKLSQFEKETIRQFEELKKSIRNISLVSIIKGVSVLDDVISLDEQNKWSNYLLKKDSLQTPRFPYPDLRRKYAQKFQKFKLNNNYELICEILQNYVLFTIPFPCRTEYSFWSCTCLTRSNGVLILGRVNIFWQETLNIHEHIVSIKINGKLKKEKILTFSIFLCKSILFNTISMQQLEDRYSSIEFTDLIYETGGQDQVNILIDVSEFLDFLYDPAVSNAIKEFNLRLMRKGGCNNKRYHCFDLADEILRTDNINFE